MTMTNPDKPITKQDLSDFYSKIQPYLGGQINPSAGFTPIGTVISVMGVIAPANYLACDGTVYNIADYQELADYFFNQFGSRNYFGGNGTTTFAVPDLRGEFLRGTGTNSHTNQGNGANVGVHQDATEHLNAFINQAGTIYIAQYQTSDRVENCDSIFNSSKARGKVNGQIESYTNDQLYTSRPTNTSVLYCIATKNIYMNPTFDYSTEEKIIGTWIDGSYIYQKTITGTINNSATQTISHNITNIEKGWVIGFIIANKYSGLMDNHFSEFTVNSTTVEFKKTNATAYESNSCIITIQYTKSTT